MMIAQMLDPTTIVEWAVKVGPYALFAYAELRRREERDERIKSQESLAAYLDKDILAKDGIAKAIRSLAFHAFRKGSISAEEMDEK